MTLNKHRFFSGWFVLLFLLGWFFYPSLILAADQASIGPGDWLLLQLAQLMTFFAQTIGNLIVILVNVMMPILQYNGFATSPVIGGGWAVVRDTTNMFFIIILIVIAMGTVFGISKFQWRQQIPKLLIFAIVINFSRMLCGLMIDFGQVIMLTFANAIKDIAGGNIIQLFGLQSILNLSESKVEALHSTGGVTAFDLFGAAFAATILMTLVLVTMGFMVVILAYRIVTLWVLVVIAPLAWFMGAAGQFLGPAQGVWADWWKRFTCAVAIGPVVVFFLWLALAVAGGGSIAADEGFVGTTQTQEANDYGSVLEIMDTSHLISFVIGIAILFAGFEAANKVCQGVPGKLGNAGKDMEKLGKNVLSKYQDAGKYSYRQTVGRPVDYAAQRVARPMLEKIGQNQTLQKIPLVGRPVARKAAVGAEYLKQSQIKRAEEYTKKDQPISAKAMAAYLKAGPSMLSGVGKQQYIARLAKGLKDKDVLKELDPKDLKKILDHRVSEGGPGSKGVDGSKSMAEIMKDRYGKDKDIKEIYEKYPATMGSVSNIKEVDDLKKVDSREWDNPETFKQLFAHIQGQMVYDKEKKQDVSLLEFVHSGKAGPALKKSIGDGEKKFSADPDAKQADILAMDAKNIDVAGIDLPNLTPEVIEKILKSGDRASALEIQNRVGTFNQDDIQRMKQHGLLEGKEEDRAKFRVNLMEMLASPLSTRASGFNTDQAREMAFDIDLSTNQFKNEQAEHDFREITKQDVEFTINVIDYSQHNNPLAKTASAYLSREVQTQILLDLVNVPSRSPQQLAIENKVTDMEEAKEHYLNDLETKMTTIIGARNYRDLRGEEKKSYDALHKEQAEVTRRFKNFSDQFDAILRTK
ncbi:hypothetical protein CO172_02070 [Candidatus Uhrbacteria bacterium CG_4_9_14_3_um_filter_36_7]|uniref:Uncharacterized protein n=1 Tax=Candidatus Uhrbacteria bacterium CG_4_9_14_3_um_filter_36_7 TaxID=1975033 RepID=A0A2M7XHF2_9BACT|nr:MAG: hypothetical protein CO172_02070 [Candidatus Uhrbacteria bacterium CG_4_9_14_3_um_filter_36_7]